MNSATGSDDPRDYLLDQGFENYTDADHSTWRALASRQREILKGRIADQFLEGLDRLGIGEAGIPDFRVMNQRLKAATGWEVVAVPG
jgi:phenylalanine-4-hydroxylase